MAEDRGKKPRNDDADEDYEMIPFHVMEVVLMKLPAKSLARFKAVAKCWKESISCPQFNVSRWKSRPCSTDCIIWGSQPHSGTFSLLRVDLSRNKFSMDPSVYRLESPALPLCSSNGVVLFKSLSGDEMSLLLVNPTFRSESEVIKILTQRRKEDFGVNYGHYYDRKADDYKVAVISREGGGEEYYSVYSCRDSAWSEKTLLLLEGLDHERGLFVNGCFYWWAREERLVVGLNVREGSGWITGGPAEVRSVHRKDKIKLTEVMGRLGLYTIDKERTRFRVWLMDKDGVEGCFGAWREMINIQDNEPVSPLSLLGEEDRVVFIITKFLRHSMFFVFNDKEKCYEEIVCSLLYDSRWRYLIKHSETLFSIRRFLQKKKDSAGAGTSSSMWSPIRE